MEEAKTTNIVKQVCQELGINQSELAKRLDVGTSAISEWKNGKIPKMAQLALELMLTNKRQQNQLYKIKETWAIIQEIE